MEHEQDRERHAYDQRDGKGYLGKSGFHVGPGKTLTAHPSVTKNAGGAGVFLLETEDYRGVGFYYFIMMTLVRAAVRLFPKKQSFAEPFMLFVHGGWCRNALHAQRPILLSRQILPLSLCNYGVKIAGTLPALKVATGIRCDG